jgi:membrane associated rhomboid family serine protease
MHETEYTLEPVKEKKKILVIGGGPGGMKAAATAAQRGYDVTLWEKKERLGGAMAAAGAPEFKKDVRDQVEYLIRQMDKYGVHTVLGKAASLQDVKDFNPDFTVVATGCDPIIIPVPGKDRPIVTFAVGIVCILIFAGIRFLNFASEAEAAIFLGAYYKPFIIAGEFWRFLTAGFVHIDLWHILMNMLALRNLGSLTKTASSLLMMTPVGGCGFLLVGIIADATNLVIPFIIPLVGYILVGLYGFGLVVHYREKPE